jgi:hypothetical protein
MTLDEFVKEQKELLDEFKDRWEGHGEAEMIPGEWDEQFLSFVDEVRAGEG